MAIVTERWDGIAVDVEASAVKLVRRAGFRWRTATRGTYGAEAYGKGVGFWHPEAGVKLAVIPAGDGGKATAGERTL